MSARILVVDDTPINLKLASELLQFEGYTVDEATDATTAQACLRRARPDLILMDLGLPGMDGLTLTRRLKADPATRDIRIVALTASAMRGDEKKAIEAGCDGYITKPIDTREFPRLVAAALVAPRRGAP